MRCAAWIGRTSTRDDPRCPNEGTHDEMTEPYGDGRRVWISWCDFHFRRRASTGEGEGK